MGYMSSVQSKAWLISSEYVFYHTHTYIYTHYVYMYICSTCVCIWYIILWHDIWRPLATCVKPSFLGTGLGLTEEALKASVLAEMPGGPATLIPSGCRLMGNWVNWVAVDIAIWLSVKWVSQLSQLSQLLICSTKTQKNLWQLIHLISESVSSLCHVPSSICSTLPTWPMARSAPVDERQLAAVGVWNPAGAMVDTGFPVFWPPS